MARSADGGSIRSRRSRTASQSHEDDAKEFSYRDFGAGTGAHAEPISPVDNAPPANNQTFYGSSAGAELRRNAYRRRHRDWPIWPIYVKEATQRDVNLTRELDSSMDVLLIFTGLFSAVVSSFLSQMSQIPGIGPSLGLWFAALTFSLSAALLAILSKTWMREYTAGLTSLAYDKARQQQFRYNGLKQWRLSELVNALPFLLHIAVFLFYLGLVLFLQVNAGGAVFIIITILFGITFAIYLSVSLMPLFFADCPYKTPLVKVVRRWFLWKVNRNALEHASLQQQEMDSIEERSALLEAQALAWMIEACEMKKDSEAAHVAVETITDLDGTREERLALFNRGVLSVLYRLLLDSDEEEEENRIVSLLKAIEALWEPDQRGWIQRKVSPKDEFHNGFFTRLVELMETSNSEKILEAAVQLPKQFAGWPIAEWPISSRISVPAIIYQIERGLFSKPANLAAALDVVKRVFGLMRRAYSIRPFRQRDLYVAIPAVAHVLASSQDEDVRESALLLILEIDGILPRTPKGWVGSNLALFTNSGDGLLFALLSLLAADGNTSPLIRKLVRQLLVSFCSRPDIGLACVEWIVDHGGISSVVEDLKIFKGDRTEIDSSVLSLLDALTDENRLMLHLPSFIETGFIAALTRYFRDDDVLLTPLLQSTVCAIIRRLLPLSGTPEASNLLRTGFVQATLVMFGTFQPNPENRETVRQVLLCQQSLAAPQDGRNISALGTDDLAIFLGQDILGNPWNGTSS